MRIDLLSMGMLTNLQSLHWFLLCDTNILLLQWNRPKAVIKEEQTLCRIHAHKRCHIFIIW